MLLSSTSTPLRDLVSEYAPKLTNGVALAASDPWFRALMLAADEILRQNQEALMAAMNRQIDEEAKKRQALEARVDKLCSQLFKLQYRGSDE